MAVFTHAPSHEVNAPQSNWHDCRMHFVSGGQHSGYGSPVTQHAVKPDWHCAPASGKRAHKATRSAPARGARSLRRSGDPVAGRFEAHRRGTAPQTAGGAFACRSGHAVAESPRRQIAQISVKWGPLRAQLYWRLLQPKLAKLGWSQIGVSHPRGFSGLRRLR